MSASAENPLRWSAEDYAEADRRISRRKWPFIDRLPLLQTFGVSDVPGQLAHETARTLLAEAGFSKPIDIDPGTQARVFYKAERTWYGLLVAYRNRIRAPEIQRRKRRQSALWLALFFGLAIFLSFAVGEPRAGGPIPWEFVLLLVFLLLPIATVAIYYGVEIGFSWWWQEAVRIVYAGIRPDLSASTAVVGYPTEVRVWIYGGRVLAGGGALGQWRGFEPSPTLAALAVTWRAAMEHVVASVGGRPT